MKHIVLMAFAVVFFIALHSCGNSKFAEWGNNVVSQNTHSSLSSSYDKMKKTDKKIRKKERKQEKNIPEGIKKYMDN